MILKNTSNKYGLITKLFHWLIAIMIICLITVGFIMTNIEPSAQKWELYGLHKATGVIVLILVTSRYLWRLMNKNVNLPSSTPNWQKLASSITHILLYVFMFLMPISGIMMSRFAGFDIHVFDLFTIPAVDKNIQMVGVFHDLHSIAAIGFTLLIGLHIIAALYHHFIRKDNILIRMIK